MRTFTAIVERDPETNLFVGYIPGFVGAHSQGTSLDELQSNLREVDISSIGMPTAVERPFRFMQVAMSRLFFCDRILKDIGLTPEEFMERVSSS